MAPIAHSKVTAKGRASVPAAVRRRLGVSPGEVLEWNEAGAAIVVKKSKRYSFDDLHRSLYPKGPPKRKTLAEMKEGVEQYIRKRHARR